MGGGLPGPAGPPMPHDRPVPEYPLLPGLPSAPGPAQVPGDRPKPAERPADCSAAGAPHAAGAAAARRRTAANWPQAPDYPAVPPYLSVRDHPPAPDRPATPPAGHQAPVRQPGGLTPRRPAAGGTAGRRAAVLGYLTVPVFLVPLVIYLATLRGPGWTRQHAAQAVNVWFTGLFYDLSAVIMGAMLALDSPRVALAVFAPLTAARWLVTLACLIRAARAATREAAYTFPAWLCMRVAR